MNDAGAWQGGGRYASLLFFGYVILGDELADLKKLGLKRPRKNALTRPQGFDTNQKSCVVRRESCGVGSGRAS